MKKLWVALILLLFWVGLCMIVAGSLQAMWRSGKWFENLDAEAAKLCRPDETLAITRRDTGTRVYYNYYCDDALSHRRNIGDELSDKGPGLDDMGLVFAGVGGVLGGIVLGVLVGWYNKKTNPDIF
ncbi:MAG: hypothetical protein HY862_06905 [Chloroflexi bacterium]|nr:hypothetical protein [Chloroflexota bacterium]